jgi:hypothetical protein
VNKVDDARKRDDRDGSPQGVERELRKEPAALETRKMPRRRRAAEKVVHQAGDEGERRGRRPTKGWEGAGWWY